MSENGEVQDLQAEKSEVVSENQTQDNGAQEAAKDRLLRESQEWKKKYLEMKDAQEKAERERLKAKGELSEYAKRLEQDLEKERQSKLSMQEQIVFTNIKAEVAAKCPDAHSIKHVMTELDSMLEKEDIDVDRQSVVGLDDKLAIIRKMNPFLFKQNIAGVEKKLPQYKQEALKRPENMSIEEHKKWIIENYK
jgi:hypothetical protein